MGVLKGGTIITDGLQGTVVLPAMKSYIPTNSANALNGFVQSPSTQRGTVDVPQMQASVGGGGTGSTNKHSNLLERDLPDQHPIDAITGLRDKLNTIPKKGDYLTENDLGGAINDALEQAKESGQFDGEDGTQFVTDETLSLQNGVLSVNRATEPDLDNTLPITAAAVATTVGNIEILLQTI